MDFARRSPARVTSLPLIAPAGLSRRINPDFALAFAEIGDPEDARRVLSLLVAEPKRISRQMVDGVIAYLERPGVRDALRRVVSANFRNGDQQNDYVSTLAALSMPVRVLWGERDRILSVPNIPGIEAEIVPAAGHMPHMEAPAQVNRLLLAERGLQV
jgi:pyruvate dehydrogenase E2 component (dihydrolipoamide acetyltransferase)